MVNYSETLDDIFATLSNSTRRAILKRLSKGPATVSALAEPFHISLPAISKHLQVLEKSGLLKREKNGRVHHCQLNGKPLKEALAWIEQYRSFWELQFDALEEYLTTTTNQSKGKP